MFLIEPLTQAYNSQLQAKIDDKTKPLGALGDLESLAKQLCQIQLTKLLAQQNQASLATEDLAGFTAQINQPELIVFAGDHGVAAEGVSIAPSEVTSQMVANFSYGGAAINVFCRQLGWQMTVVDAGTLIPPESGLAVVSQRLGDITQAINLAPAMSRSQVEQGFSYAKALVTEKVNNGCDLIAFGEMGIGNTTVAAAIMSAIMNVPARKTVGKGTGVTDEVVLRKQQVVTQALSLHAQQLADPYDLLAGIGGFEIVQITGAMLAAAEQKIAVVVDGFICTAAALVAIKINPNIKEYLIFAHCSGEQGHQKMLTYLGVKPLLNLGLRLGEGTGAALSLPLLQAAVGFYNEMASFSQAAVTNVVDNERVS
jgi:nicotinate-nucleotide--dimethylbenzimidazole phosphoribosyltransferase